jgi:hypothetical protein
MLSGARFRASGIRTHHSFATERPAAGRLYVHLLLFYTNAYSNVAAIPDHGSDDACLRHHRFSHGSCRSNRSRRTGTAYRSDVTWSISFDRRCCGTAYREWGCEEEGGRDGAPGIERSQCSARSAGWIRSGRARPHFRPVKRSRPRTLDHAFSSGRVPEALAGPLIPRSRLLLVAAAFGCREEAPEVRRSVDLLGPLHR